MDNRRANECETSALSMFVAGLGTGAMIWFLFVANPL